MSEQNQVKTVEVPNSTPASAGAVTSVSTASLLPQYATAQVMKEGDLISRDLFTPERIREAVQRADAVDFSNTSAILNFGAASQRQLSSFIDSLLQEVRVGDVGVAGTITLQISEGYDLMRIKELQDRLSGAVPGFFAKAFAGAKTLAALIKNFADQRAMILSKFEKIEQIGLKRSRALSMDCTKFDGLEQKTMDVFLPEVELDILTGEIALLRGAKEFEERKNRYLARPTDVKEPPRIAELARRLHSFEDRLLRIKIAYVDAAALTITRIQMIRASAEIEMQNISNALLFDLKELKLLVLQVMAMTNIQAAQAEEAARQAGMSKTRDAASGLFDETYLASIRSQGNSLETVIQMAKYTDKMLTTMKNAGELEQQNSSNRQEAAKLLVGVKKKVETALVEMPLAPVSGVA